MTDDAFQVLELVPNESPFTKGQEIRFFELAGVNLREFMQYLALSAQAIDEPRRPEPPKYANKYPERQAQYEEQLTAWRTAVAEWRAGRADTYQHLRDGYSHINEDKCFSVLIYVRHKPTNPDLTLEDIYNLSIDDFRTLGREAAADAAGADEAPKAEPEPEAPEG